MTAFPKPQRYICEEYLKWIRSKPCVLSHLCRSMPSEAHHTVTVKSGGSDLTVIPLCRQHHNFYHAKGPGTFIRAVRQAGYRKDITVSGLMYIYLKEFVESHVNFTEEPSELPSE